jgi:TolB-like protein
MPRTNGRSGIPRRMPSVDPAEAVAAVRRVLASDAFARSPKSRDFLAYVASEVLAGREDNLHERLIARRALGRGPDFDGRADAGVRVQAHRLRTALDTYYGGEGSREPVVVSLPVGRYAPTFSRADLDPPAALPDVPTTSVGVVSSAEEDRNTDLRALLLQTLAHHLAQVPDLIVAGPSHRHVADVVAIARDLGVRYLLRGEVTGVGAGMRVKIFLIDGSSGQVFWSNSESLAVVDDSVMVVIEEVAAAAAAHLGDYAGIIIRRALADHEPTAAGPSARLAFYRHIIHGGAETLGHARTAVERALVEGDIDPHLHAMYGFVLSASVHYRVSESPEDDLERATDEARRALRQDPRSSLAHLALALAGLEQHAPSLSRSHALRAVELAPGHPSTLFSAGGILATIGEWDIGVELMKKSFMLNPLHPPYQHVNLAVERLLHDDFAGALLESSIVDDGGLAWGPLCRALAYGGLGLHDEGAREIVRVQEYLPELWEDPKAAIAELFANPDEQSKMLALLRTLDPT